MGHKIIAIFCHLKIKIRFWDLSLAEMHFCRRDSWIEFLARQNLFVENLKKIPAPLDVTYHGFSAICSF
jgi:hypothetical protein